MSQRVPTIEAPAAAPEAPKRKDEPKIVDHKQFGLKLRLQPKGVVVLRVEKSSTAESAGLRKGDIITSIGSIPVTSLSDVTSLDDVLKPGDQVELEYRRGKNDAKTLIAFGQEIKSEELDVLAMSESATPATGPTPALQSADASGADDVVELRRLVQSQQEVIARLKGRIHALEQGTTPSRRDIHSKEASVDASLFLLK